MSTDVAVQVAKRFLRTMAQPFSGVGTKRMARVVTVVLPNRKISVFM